MLRYFEAIRGVEGGHSVNGYIENFARDFFTNLTLKERRQVIAAGENFPTSALSILAKLPATPGPDVLAEMRALDQRLDGREGEAIARLRVGLTAVLGASGEPESLAYLREVYANDPDRRSPVAMSLTQSPDGENWDVLVDSLRTIDGIATPEVLAALTQRAAGAEDGRAVSQRDSARAQADAVGRRAGGEVARTLDGPADAVAADRADSTEKARRVAGLVRREVPGRARRRAAARTRSRTSGASRSSRRTSKVPEGKAGNPQSGAQLFTTAQCIKCHRFNGTGESAGPDLTTLGQRFQRKEMLESIVFPSHVVSDQYASQIVMANGRAYTGIVTRAAGRQRDGAAIGRRQGDARGRRDRRDRAEQDLGDAGGPLESAHARAGGRPVRVPDGRLERDDGGPGNGAAAVRNWGRSGILNCQGKPWGRRFYSSSPRRAGRGSGTISTGRRDSLTTSALTLPTRAWYSIPWP